MHMCVYVSMHVCVYVSMRVCVLKNQILSKPYIKCHLQIKFDLYTIFLSYIQSFSLDISTQHDGSKQEYSPLLLHVFDTQGIIYN